MEDGAIVGLHGRADDEGLHAIGVYVVPTGFLSTTRSECRMQHKVDKSMIMVVPREPGPWGGLGGKQWDDGVFTEIHELHLEYGDSAIHSLQIMYETKEGKRDWSHRHGGPGGDRTYKMKLVPDPKEFLVGISGFMGLLKEMMASKHCDLLPSVQTVVVMDLSATSGALLFIRLCQAERLLDFMAGVVDYI
ncbi:Agglutinin [Morella rubra]|uniref:Agglutinin n=1 Tax=Morella rubra TaxID=262757 RepID=A0A6A1V8U4_9ROSI|nr:Agglutinin [Morella rubra]